MKTIYAIFSCSHISGLSDTHGFVNSGWVKNGSYSEYCSKYPMRLKFEIDMSWQGFVNIWNGLDRICNQKE